jgi:hypothetical protein
MSEATRGQLAAAGIEAKIGTVLADAGSFSSKQVEGTAADVGGLLLRCGAVSGCPGPSC